MNIAISYNTSVYRKKVVGSEVLSMAKKTAVLHNTSVYKPQYLLDPNALKYLILQYF